MAEIRQRRDWDDSGLALGERIAVARTRAGLSQPALAEKLGRSETWMQRAEKDRSTVTLQQLEAIATHTGAPLWFLTHGFDGQPGEALPPRLEARIQAVEDELRRLRD